MQMQFVFLQFATAGLLERERAALAIRVTAAEAELERYREVTRAELEKLTKENVKLKKKVAYCTSPVRVLR